MTDTSPAAVRAPAPTVTIWSNAFAETFDRNLFVDVYNRLRVRVDQTLDVRPLYESEQVFNELIAEGWPKDRARRYTVGARICYQNDLAPATGEPLTGADLIHPLKIAEARRVLVDSAMTAADAYAALDRLIDLGWRA
jgi:hypothetical protein